MSAEARFSVIHDKLSRSGGEVLAGAISYAVDQGSPLATIEGLFVSLLKHPQVSNAARIVGIEPDFLDLARGTHPIIDGATLLWDGEVQTAINRAHLNAEARGARKAGVVDLLRVSTRHESIRDLFVITPHRLTDLDRLPDLVTKFRQNPLQRVAS